MRLAAQTATIATVSRTSAGALDKALGWMADWTGTQVEKPIVKPNLDFSKYDLEAAARSMRDLMTAKQLGLQISDESIHEIMRQSELTEKKFAEEVASMKKDAPREVATPASAVTVAGQNGASTRGE